MSPIFRNLGKIPEETAHVLQNLVSAKGLTGYSQSCSASAIFPYSQKVTFIADLHTNMRM